MFVREFECPSCGAPIQQKTPGARTLVCSFCGQTSHLNADSLEMAGNKHMLIDYGSVLQVGQSGRLGEREFMVLGRLRIDYEDGFWDEWYVQFLDNGTEGWIQEDDGDFVFFQAIGKLAFTPELMQASVGSTVDVGAPLPPIFVTSKAEAKVNGGEGELPFQIIPGEPADFIEGIAEGRIISIEALPAETVAYSGRPFPIEALIN